MGYYSEVMIAVTKKDFKKVEDAQAKMTENLLDYVNKHDYKENNKDCVFMYWDSLKYYKEFEEVQALEKSLSKLKDGYVFCRLGEESGDIEFRKRTKIPELMKEFQFIRDIRKKLNEELKEEQENKQNINKEETQTKQKIVYTNNKYDVLNMFENKIEMTKDGMSGILELQNNSLDIKIKDSYIEQYKVALTKKYENVPTNELNDIPKSIEENGVTYYLVNPIWNISQVEKIEGQDVPIAYNGEMQYEGIKERKIVKSYLATVTYIGTLEKEETESITFNIKYKEMPQEEIEEKTNYTPIVVATAGTGILVISGIFLWKRKKKNKIA